MRHAHDPVLLLVAVLLRQSFGPGLIGAQPTVTATGARALVDACLAHAKANKQRVGIAVVDPYGNLLDYHTMEGTNVIAGRIGHPQGEDRGALVAFDRGAERTRAQGRERGAGVDRRFPAARRRADLRQRGHRRRHGHRRGWGDECAKAAIAAVLKGANTPLSTPP